jgi:uncharacterized protein (TIGR00730 family)
MGFHAEYEDNARKLGKHLSENKIELIYGGGSVGLMGVLANTVLESGGKVTGVIPRFLYEQEVGHDGVSELIIVESMHERKQKMAELSEGFVAFPGGIGTMEELFEIYTWLQLALIKSPVALLNINNYFDHIVQFLDNMVSAGFLKRETRELLIVSDDIDSLLAQMEQFAFIEEKKWIDRT